MEAIAMKMNQEEFDSINDLLKDKTYKITFFTGVPYLVNNFGGEIGVISNVNSYDKNKNNREVYEYFDRDIFLKACDIEVDKVFECGTIQVWDGFRWYDSNNKYRLKPQPDYSKEIKSLQDKAKENGMKAIITFKKI